MFRVEQSSFYYRFYIGDRKRHVAANIKQLHLALDHWLADPAHHGSVGVADCPLCNEMEREGSKL